MNIIKLFLVKTLFYYFFVILNFKFKPPMPAFYYKLKI
jgi:hypothetical protein